MTRHTRSWWITRQVFTESDELPQKPFGSLRSRQRKTSARVAAGAAERHERWIDFLHIGQARIRARRHRKPKHGVAQQRLRNFGIARRIKPTEVFHRTAGLGIEEVQYGQGREAAAGNRNRGSRLVDRKDLDRRSDRYRHRVTLLRIVLGGARVADYERAGAGE